MIHYIFLWGENSLNRKLDYSPAGLKKAKYIVNILSKIEKTKIVSFARGGCQWNGLYWYASQKWNNDVNIDFCITFGSRNKYLRMIERWFNIFQMFLYLIRIPKKDIVVFYHERYFRHAIKMLRFFRSSPRIVLQVEEIYTMAGNYPTSMIECEIKSIKTADAYILVNDIISSVLNLDIKKPSCISYGPYLLPNFENTLENIDGRIHIVYAGIIDRIKKGAEMAVNASMYLPSKYCVHIAGFGKEEDVVFLQTLIDKVSNKCQCEIIFEGCLNGYKYDELMNKCSIGLSTQVSGEFKYADTSFPSKIINYLSYGLSVVSTKIQVLEKCQLSDLLSFYNDDSPKSIANAILNCPLIDKQFAKNRILNLDNQFQKELKEVIQCLRKC